jgi:hypothetical protein
VIAGLTFALMAFLADAAAVAATHSWPRPASSLAVYGLLAVGWGLSVIAFLLLRSGGGGGDEPPAPEPEPPWWPEFERQFREYTRERPRTPNRRPRAPAGAGTRR